MRATTPDTFKVRKSLTVAATQKHAFDVFVNQLARWWPLDSHVLGEKPAQTAIIERHAGGRWFERDRNGTECDWGRVVSIDEPKSIVLSWQISADWKFDPSIYTEVEVRFIEETAATTRVELEHRGLDAYGEKAATMVEVFNSPGAWVDGLNRFREIAES